VRAPPRRLSDPRLRRLALRAQGLTGEAPFGRGLSGAQCALEHLGYVQIDTISVVARAHQHTLWTRVPSLTPAGDALDRLVAQREAFEHWFHAAAYLPMRDYRFALPLMRRIRQGKTGWHRAEPRRMRKVLDRIRSEGPLRARDFEDPHATRGSWWSWKPDKRALERLFMQGDLMIAGRDGFQKIYDLTERILPPNTIVSEPSLSELADHLIDTALRAHGFTTLSAVVHERRTPGLRAAVNEVLLERVRAGELSALELASGKTAFMLPGALDTRIRTPERAQLLSPFDNALIHRERTAAVYEFDYQIECYVPAPRRKFGYFCLPVLYRDQLVGRADCKAHRAQSRLELVHLHLERDVGDRERFARRLAEALRAFAAFNACCETSVQRTSPRDFRRELLRALG
jgi:uncharacterized protein YcaQ